MTSMIGKAPGVYIEEVPATGPIAGVGTSTAAFIGPTLTAVGLIYEPTLVTNWSQFKNQFGDFSASPRLYLPHAVRGFFDNGGTTAYIVSVASARAFVELDDRATANPGKAIRVESASANGTDISVAIQDGPIVGSGASAKVVKSPKINIASATGSAVVLQTATDAQQFQPGDWITIDSATGPTTERALIDNIQGGQLNLKTALSGTFTNTATVRVADLQPNQTTFRIALGTAPSTAIEAGTVLHLAQGPTQGDYVVNGVMGSFVTLAKPGLTTGFKLGATDPDVAVTTTEFNLVVTKAGAPAPTTFANLSMSPRHSRYFITVVEGNPNSPINVMMANVPSTQAPPLNFPKVTSAAVALAPGLPSSTSSLGLNSYLPALDALTRVDGVNMVCVPDAAGNTDVQQKVLAHCETMRDRFAIFDPAATAGASLPDPGTKLVIAQRPALDSNNPDSGPGFGALYFPWIVINDPLRSLRQLEAGSPCRPRGTSRAFMRASTMRAAFTRLPPMNT